jgi:membrane protein YqaA with SNARE-associated domain
LPAFAPPTWTVIVFYRLNSNLNVVALVVIGVLAAATARYLLGSACYRLRNRLKESYLANLEQARKFFDRGNGFRLAYFALFAISPLPSAQLFEAAGLMEVRLLPVTAIFAAGRVVTYSLYAAGASTIKATGLGNVMVSTFKSPWGLAGEILALAIIYFITVKPFHKKNRGL